MVDSSDDNSYTSVLTEYFGHKHPKAVRIFNFFHETQRPNETSVAFIQRCEALAIKAEIKSLPQSEIIKYKMITGLTQDEKLRARLLRLAETKNFDNMMLKEEVSSYEATKKVANAIDKQLNGGQVQQISQYRSQQRVQKQSQYRHTQPFRGAQQRPSVRPQMRPFQNQTRMQFIRPQLRGQPDLRCRACGFWPFFECKQHVKSAEAAAAGRKKYGHLINRNVNVIDQPEADENEEHLYVNTINAIEDVVPTMDDGMYDRDENGLPIMTNPARTPLLFAFVRQDKREWLDEGCFRRVPTPITEVLCLPDSGCAKTIMHPKLAKMCQFEIDNTDNILLHAANGAPLESVGSVHAQLDYFGVVTYVKIFIVNGINDNYVYLDHHVCRYLNILPREFPLPLQRCNLSVLHNPPNIIPFAGAAIPNPQTAAVIVPPWEDGEHANEHPEEQIAVPEDFTRKKMTTAIPDKQEIDVTTSFTSPHDKSNAMDKLNKLIAEYSSVHSGLP